jgi:Holliday junction DNA helicase RuvA
MRVLGVDPGLTRCGLGVVDGLPGRQPRLIAVDVVRTPAELDTARRLVLLEEALDAWIRDHRPTAVAIERVFAQHNVQTVMGTAQAAGVAMLVAARRGIPVTLHTPSEVKAAITGSGRAGKEQVGAMVTRILRLEEAPRPADAADALALAICHVWRGGTTARLDAAMDGGRRPVGPAAAGLQAGGAVIASVSGPVLAVGPTSAVVEVGGLGILTLCSPNTVAGLRIGQRTTLATALVVREDSLALYGFASADEREFFELLLTATGVGPKLAQAALAVLRPDELRQAIATENLVVLCKVPGIGRKGAQRIVLELKDKINAVGLGADLAPLGTTAATWRDQVAQGLVGLGWSARDADAACDEVEHLVADDPAVGVPVLMRAALQSLARS